ncbi:hypothetical protein [Gemella haemolysans]|uniref:hypothetical protein n=1 Tax=Gemella haemolysans TaxID=1379 RepID=UPI00195DF8B9|nr:hypothetical protein [Gemella haemolysans]VTX52220.1 Uncharacterised protein [Gemella haemolysans]
MQLSREQLIKLDKIIERYSEDETIKEASTIKEYLNTHPAKIQELLITVYFNLSRKATEEESKVINEHKINLFNILSEKGYIKDEKKRTTKTTEQRLNNDKKQKLNRYRALTEQLYRLYDLVEELQEKQHSKSHVQTMDYTKVKITCSRTNYDFTGTNLLAKIQDTENKISKLKIAIEKEREYLSSVIDQIEDIRIRYIFWWRYYMLEEWQKVARLVGLKSERYCMKLHNEYLEKLDI